MSVAALVALALVLAGPVPRLMARQVRFRRSPRAPLVVWQAVGGGAVLAALAAPPLFAVQSRAAALVGPAVLVALARGHARGAALAAGGSTARARMELLSEAAQALPVLTGSMYTCSRPRSWRLHRRCSPAAYRVEC